MQSITVESNRQPFIIREVKLQLDYFHSDDEDDTFKPRSLSCLDSTKEERADTKKRLVKKSESSGQKHHEGQRPVRRKSSKFSTKPLPGVPEEVRIQKLPQRSTSSRTSSSDEFSDLQAEFRRERRSRRSPNPRAFSRPSIEKDPDLQDEFRRERSLRQSSIKRRSPNSMESSSHRPRRSSSMQAKSPEKGSRNGKQSGRLRRSSSSSSLSDKCLTPKRSGSRNYRKSPTPREWYQQLQENDDPQKERPGSRRKNSKSPKVRESSRKSLKNDNKDEQHRKSLGRRKSTSFRKESPGRVGSRETPCELEATPLEWYQQLQRREDQQEERPRSKKSLRKSESLRRLSLTSLESLSKRKSESLRRRSLTSLESLSKTKSESLRRRSLTSKKNLQEEHSDERTHRRRRSTSTKRSSKSSRSSRRSPTPREPPEFYIVEDNTERLTKRTSLGKKSSSFRRKKSPTPLEPYNSHDREGEEESRGSRRSLAKKSTSFGRRHSQEDEVEVEHSSSKKSLGKPLRRKNSQTLLGSSQHQYQKPQEDQDDLGPRRKSLLERSASFSNRISQPRRSLTPDRLRPRRSLGKKVSLRNIFGNKNEQSSKDGELDWKELGFKECSYYQNPNSTNSVGELKRILSSSKNRLSSLTKLSSFSRNNGNNQAAEGMGLLNATWDKQDPEAEKTVGPMKSWSAFGRGSNSKLHDNGEDTTTSSSFQARHYEDISIHNSPIRNM